MDDSDIYPWKDLPLTPAIMAELVIVLFAGKQIQRKVLIQAVPEYHKKHGGRATEANGCIPGMKRALQNLQRKGLAQKTGVSGYWLIRETEESGTSESITFAKESEVLLDTPELSKSMEIDKYVGTGKQSVYVYTYDAYKELAKLKGEKYWFCKIGRTEVDPMSRILSQSVTALPEYPHVLLIIRTEDSSKLEQAIHAMLKAKDRQFPESPGNERFKTNVDEVLKIYQLIQE